MADAKFLVNHTDDWCDTVCCTRSGGDDRMFVRSINAVVHTYDYVWGAVFNRSGYHNLLYAIGEIRGEGPRPLSRQWRKEGCGIRSG